MDNLCRANKVKPKHWPLKSKQCNDTPTNLSAPGMEWGQGAARKETPFEGNGMTSDSTMILKQDAFSRGPLEKLSHE